MTIKTIEALEARAEKAEAALAEANARVGELEVDNERLRMKYNSSVSVDQILGKTRAERDQLAVDNARLRDALEEIETHLREYRQYSNRTNLRSLCQIQADFARQALSGAKNPLAEELDAAMDEVLAWPEGLRRGIGPDATSANIAQVGAVGDVVAAARALRLVHNDRPSIGYNVVFGALRKALDKLDAGDEREWKPTHRHKKTGGLYRIIAKGRLEIDLTPVVIYQALATHEYWVRPTAEFDDGRFDKLDAEGE